MNSFKLAPKNYFKLAPKNNELLKAMPHATISSTMRVLDAIFAMFKSIVTCGIVLKLVPKNSFKLAPNNSFKIAPKNFKIVPK